MNKGGNMSKVNIKVKSFDYLLVDFGVKKIIELVIKSNIKFSGLVLFFIKREVVIILRLVYINKKLCE